MLADFTRLSVYVNRELRKEKPFNRLLELAQKQDRSLNYVIIEAILEYVDREESKNS